MLSSRLMKLSRTIFKLHSNTYLKSYNFAGVQKQLDYCQNSHFHTSLTSRKNSDSDGNKPAEKEDDPITRYLSSKYKILTEENAPLILDLEAERKRFQTSEHEAVAAEQTEEDDKFSHLDLTRGLNGVFDIEQLVDLLHSEGAIDLFVCEIPKELCYADHIVIVTGRSVRHRLALAELVRKIYKHKRNSTDLMPRIEGNETPAQADWLAMDLGNIILHVFSRATREKYDLESLWCLGSKHDVQCNQKNDELLDLLTSSDMYLEDLEPAEPSIDNNKRK